MVTKMDDQNENAYKEALEALSPYLKMRGYSKKIKQQLNDLQREVKQLKANQTEDTHSLTQVLRNTAALLSGSLTPKQYEETAKHVQGSASQGMKTLGGIMLAIAVLAVSISGFTGLFIPMAAAVAANMVLTSSVCFFSGRRHGLSASMHQLNETLLKTDRQDTLSVC